MIDYDPPQPKLNLDDYPDDDDTTPPVDVPKVVQMRGRHGKPRRGSEPSVVTTLRAEPRAIESLKREFGSLGNALHYLYQGIQTMRDEAEVTTEGQDFDRSTLYRRDLEYLWVALRAYVKSEHIRDRRHVRPFRALEEKLARFLFEPNPTDEIEK